MPDVNFDFVSPRILSTILDLLPLPDKFNLRRVCQEWNDFLNDLLASQTFLRLVPDDVINERNHFWSDMGSHEISTSLTAKDLTLVLSRMTNIKTIWCHDPGYFATLLTALRNLKDNPKLESLQGVLDNTSLDLLCFEHNGSLTSLESLTFEFKGTSRSWDFTCFHELPNLTSLIIDADDKEEDQSFANCFHQRGMYIFLKERRDMPDRPFLYIRITQKARQTTTWLQSEIDWHRHHGKVIVDWITVGDDVGPVEENPALDVPVVNLLQANPLPLHQIILQQPGLHLAPGFHFLMDMEVEDDQFMFL